ncbi:MAG: hypothetical protein ACREIU_10075 [Planctomycetota bacterium]
MKGWRFETLAREIRRRFPGTRVVVDRYTPPDRDRGIRWYVRILNCPVRRLPHADEFAVRRAFELWRGIGVPFFVGAYSRRDTRRYLADRLARARIRGAPARRLQTPTRTRSRPARRRPGSDSDA